MKKILFSLIAILITLECWSQTCIAPTNLSSVQSGNNRIISWTPRGSETQWLLQYSLSTDTSFVNSTSVNLVSNQDTIRGLNPSTSYNVRVKAICSATDSSLWSSTYSFTTGCITISSLPWYESFDTYGISYPPFSNMIFPTCWSMSCYGTAIPYIYTYCYSSPGSFYIKSLANQYTIVMTPQIDNSIPINTLRAKFKLLKSNINCKLSIGVMSNTTDTSSFTEIAVVSPSLPNVWEDVEVWFNSYTGSGKYIAFKSNDTISNSVLLDNLELSLIPSCLNPTNLVANNISTTSASISWTSGQNETQWALEYKSSTTSWANATTIINNITSNNYTLTGLYGSTAYDVRVKAVCSSTNESEWSNISFYTVISSLPWSESFDSYGTDMKFPFAWTKLHDPLTSTSSIFSIHYSNPASLRLLSSANSNLIVISPKFDTSIHINTLRAKLKIKIYDASNGLSVGVMSNPNDTSSFVQIEELMPTELETWKDFEVYFNSYTGSGQYIAFKSNTPVSNNVYLDNIEITPLCFCPTNINVTNISSTSASINFSPNDPLDEEWKLYYKILEDTTWNNIIIDTNNYRLNGLIPNTHYQFYLKTLCIDSSLVSSTIDFQTNTINIDSYNNNTIFYSCGDYFYDDGGQANNHGNNYNYSLTLCPTRDSNSASPLKRSSVYFDEFDLGQGDVMRAYSGRIITPQAQLSYENVSNFTGNFLQGKTLVSKLSDTSGCITFNIITDSISVGTGFKANIECINYDYQRVIAALDTFFIKYDALGNMSTHLIKNLIDSVYSSSDNTWSLINYKCIDLCQGDSIVLIAKPQFPDNDILYHQLLNNCIYNWSFGNGQRDTTYYSNTIGYKWEDVQGYNLNLSVLDTNQNYINGKGCESNNSINTRIRISSNPIKTVNALPDMCSGQTFLLNVGYNTNSSVVVDSIKFIKQFIGTFDSTVFIPDGPQCGAGFIGCYESSVNFDEFSNGAIITSANDILSCCLNIEHSFFGDISIFLECPNGQTSTLKIFPGGGGAFLGVPYGGADHGTYDSTNPCTSPPNIPGKGWWYCFSNLRTDTTNRKLNNCPTVYVSDSSVLSYTNCTTCDSTHRNDSSNYYIPDIGFSSLIGCPKNGEWKVRVCDQWSIDNGFMFAWNLEFNDITKYKVPIDTVIWNGPFTHNQSSTTTLVTPPITDGGNYRYDIEIVDDFGCTWDTATYLNVAQTPIVNLGGDTSNCEQFSVMLDAGNIGATNYLWLPTGDTTQSILAQSFSSADSSITYIAQVINYNGSIYCYGIDSINLIVNPTPNTPTNLTVQTRPIYLEITWSGNGTSYEVYRNDTLIAISTQPIYFDSNVIDGTNYCYKIKALIGNCESEFSNVICRTFTGLEDIVNNDLSVIIYPNPTNDKTRLEIKGLKSNADVIVYDIYGRAIKTYKLNANQNELEIDVKEFAKGVYNIKVTNSDCNITKKLIVK